MTASRREEIVRGIMASPHPTEGICLHSGCGGPLTDIWAEFLEHAAEKAAVSLGTADFTCPHREGYHNVMAPFSQAESEYFTAWAREDHQGLANGPARTLQRQHGVQSAVVGQLVARLSTVTGLSQYAMVEGPALEKPILWPWPTQAAFEARLKELLPESTLHYLEKMGVLAATEVSS